MEQYPQPMVTISLQEYNDLKQQIQSYKETKEVLESSKDFTHDVLYDLARYKDIYLINVLEQDEHPQFSLKIDEVNKRAYCVKRK